MTHIELPNYIYTLFEEQINKIKRDLIINIATEYDLLDNLDSMFNKYTCDIEIISKKMENVKIIRKNNYNTNIQSINRCQARVWNDGLGARCRRSNHIDNLCHIHYNILKKKKNLKYGRITDPQPDVFKNRNQLREKIY